MVPRRGSGILAAFLAIGLLAVGAVPAVHGGYRTYAALATAQLALTGEPALERVDRAYRGIAGLRQREGALPTGWASWLEDRSAALSAAAEAGHTEGRALLAEGHRARTADSVQAARYYRLAAEAGTEQTAIEARLWLALLAHQDSGSVGQLLPGCAALPSPSGAIEPSARGGPGPCAVYVDPFDLRLGLPVHVLAIWPRAETAAESHEDARTTQYQGSEWLVVNSEEDTYVLGAVGNLVHDGSFARVVSPRAGPPVGFLPLYRRQPASACTLLRPPTSDRGLVLGLSGQDSGGVGAGSSPADVGDAQPLALLYGTYRTEGQSEPRIGLRWGRGISSADGREGKTTYLVRVPSAEWATFCGVFTAPEEAQTASAWIIETSPTGSLYVDDLGLFFIPQPSCLYEGDRIERNP